MQSKDWITRLEDAVLKLEAGKDKELGELKFEILLRQLGETLVDQIKVGQEFVKAMNPLFAKIRQFLDDGEKNPVVTLGTIQGQVLKNISKKTL